MLLMLIGAFGVVAVIVLPTVAWLLLKRRKRHRPAAERSERYPFW